MTRLRSDSSSTSTTTTTTTTNTTEEDSSVISECNNIRPELQILHSLSQPSQQHLIQQARTPTLGSAIGSDSSTDETSSSDDNNEVVVDIGQIDERPSLVTHYSNYEVLDSEDDEETDFRDQYRNRNDSRRASLLEEAVHEFGLISARRFTVGHEPDYDLRPSFAILKHKTDGNLSAEQDSRDGGRRRYPRTPDWFFNIPDTRSPFPTFSSGLEEDSE